MTVSTMWNYYGVSSSTTISWLQSQNHKPLLPADVPHLINSCGTIFLLLFVFLISLVHHHHPALLHRHALILDCLLTFLMAFFTLVLKLLFSQSISIHSHLSLPQADLVTGGGSIGKWGRLSQPSWLLMRTIVILTYLLIHFWPSLLTTYHSMFILRLVFLPRDAMLARY